ncbi:TIGR02266 family protein, partial [Pyxidicoccus fallax]|uniref:TIGR02266 family protein n=1 Tax=Pyxidicoccus fallax TaxID=394095 RepID=UPI0014940939
QLCIRDSTYSLHEFVGWERRDDRRVHVKLRVTIDSVSLFTREAANISNGGVFLAMEELLPLGERLEMTLHFDTPERHISARGVVVWQNERADMRHPRGVGVKFTALEDEARRFITYYVKKAQMRTG